MCIRSIGIWLLASVWLLAGAGCEKSNPAAEASPARDTQAAAPKAPPAETLARLHWLGKKRLEGETNAAFFMSLWDLPESAKLEAQTLDKLAGALASSVSTGTNPGLGAKSGILGILRPMLDDLLKEESYVEIRCATNEPGELGLAIRLNEDRAADWETNLPKALEQLSTTSGSVPSANNHAWHCEIENQPSKIKSRITLARAGTWTLATLSRWPADGAAPQSPGLLEDLTARIQKQHAPFVPSGTNFWLQANIDLPRAAAALACGDLLPVAIPKINLTIIGDGQNVRTRGELAFSKPLALEFDRWNIPTNLIHNPLVSFTALNGIRPWLLSRPAWTRLGLATPNQVYFWGLEGAAVETYFAASVPDASNTVYAVSGRLIEACNRWLNTNRMGQLERATNANGLAWKGFPFVAPFLKSVEKDGNSFAFGGLGPESPVTNAIPEALVREINTHSNLVCYDWEITGSRILSGIYISQLARVMLQKAQLPKNSSSLEWLKAISSKLGNCGTEITAEDSTHIAFVRKSGCGLTAAELHLLADWLESPRFPVGLHTLLAPPPPPPGERVASDKGH